MEQSLRYSIPILNTVFGLSKSFSKKVCVGLEPHEYAGVEMHRPVIRIVGKDFVGVQFTEKSWEDFKKAFTDMDEWLGTGDPKDTLKDQKIYGEGWSVHFTYTRNIRAVEIEEEHHESGRLVKRFRHSVVMTGVSYENLRNHLVKCIDARVAYLSTIAYCVSRCMYAIERMLLDKIRAQYESQVQIVDIDMLEKCIKNFDFVNHGLVKVKSLMETTKQEPFKILLNDCDIIVIFWQMCTTDLNNFVEKLNDLIQADLIDNGEM